MLEPLKLAGMVAETALAEAVQTDISNRASDLPLLQVALRAAWQEHVATHRPMLECYQNVGRVSGALAREADKARERLSKEDQGRLESIFVRLVRLGDTGGATRLAASLDDFDPKRRALLQKLGQDEYGRLVSVGETQAELAHEALITQWPWLQDMLKTNAAEVRVLDRLRSRSDEWRYAPPDRMNHYVATGAERETFDELAKRHVDWLSRADKDFISASAARVEATEADRLRYQARLERVEIAAKKYVAEPKPLFAQRTGIDIAVVALLAIIGANLLVGAFGLGRLTVSRSTDVAQITAKQLTIAGAALVIFSWALVVLVLYWRNPGHLTRWLEALPEPPAIKEAASPLDKLTYGAFSALNVIIRASLLFLGTSPRALDAWVSQRTKIAGVMFNTKASVRDRRIALDLPIRVDGARHANPWNELGFLLSQQNPITILICGSGGSGKTTLACEIARRALGADHGPSIAPSAVLPLFVEADLPDETADQGGLYPYLAGLLRSAVNDERRISVRLTKALLRSGRVLVIVDGLSERSAATRRVFNPTNLGFEVARLIATSREPEFPGMATVVEIEPIPPGSLFDFLARYLQEDQRNRGGDLPTEDHIYHACGDLKLLLRDRPCTPLLAAMWAIEIAARSIAEVSKPRDVADLIDSYVRRVLLPAANGNEALVDRLTKDAAKIAERELGNQYLPGALTRSRTLEVIRALDPSEPDKRFGLLLRSRLLEASSQYSDAVLISPDPVAEHLVARLRAEELGGDLQRWQDFLDRITKHRLPTGFATGLAACVENHVYGYAVPQEIRDRIKRFRGKKSKATASEYRTTLRSPSASKA